MSGAHAHDTGHHQDHMDGHHEAHGTLKGYMIGFGLSVILTAIPFWLVMAKPLYPLFNTNVPVAILLMGFAVVQMVVHMIFFLHMHPKSQGGWNLMALFFTLTLVVIVMSGSMWVMYHLNSNMMPSHSMESVDPTGEALLPSNVDPSQKR